LPPTLRSMATHPESIKNKVSSCHRIICILLQTITSYLPLIDHSSTWNWEILSTRDDIDGIRHCVEDIGPTLVLPKSTKQGEFLSACMHFAKYNHVLTCTVRLDRFIHRDFGKSFVTDDTDGFRQCRRRCYCFSCCSVFGVEAREPTSVLLLVAT
jgi:hypothetical protein